MISASCRQLLAGSLLDKRYGRAIPELEMLPVAVVEDLEIFRDLLPGLFPCFMPPVLHELILQRPPRNSPSARCRSSFLDVISRHATPRTSTALSRYARDTERIQVVVATS